MDELVATKKINTDQKAQAEKKPALQASVAQIEEQIGHLKDFAAHYEQRLASQKAELTKLHQDEVKAVQEKTAAEAKEASKKDQRAQFLSLSKFLYTAATMRRSGDETSNVTRAFEGVLYQIYTGSHDAVASMIKVVEGVDEPVVSVEGETLEVTCRSPLVPQCFSSQAFANEISVLTVLIQQMAKSNSPPRNKRLRPRKLPRMPLPSPTLHWRTRVIPSYRTLLIPTVLLLRTSLLPPLKLPIKLPLLLKRRSPTPLILSRRPPGILTLVLPLPRQRMAVLRCLAIQLRPILASKEPRLLPSMSTPKTRLLRRLWVPMARRLPPRRPRRERRRKELRTIRDSTASAVAAEVDEDGAMAREDAAGASLGVVDAVAEAVDAAVLTAPQSLLLQQPSKLQMHRGLVIQPSLRARGRYRPREMSPDADAFLPYVTPDIFLSILLSRDLSSHILPSFLSCGSLGPPASPACLLYLS